MVSFPLEGLIGHGNGRGGFGHGPEKYGAPANRVLLFAEKGGQVELFQEVRRRLDVKKCAFQRYD